MENSRNLICKHENFELREYKQFGITDYWVSCANCGVSTLFFDTPEKAKKAWDNGERY